MKKLDYFIQKQRILQAEKFISGSSILDIGCHHGELFKHILKKKTIYGDGIDGVLTDKIETNNYTLFPGYFPNDFPIKKKLENMIFIKEILSSIIHSYSKFYAVSLIISN